MNPARGNITIIITILSIYALAWLIPDAKDIKIDPKVDPKILMINPTETTIEQMEQAVVNMPNGSLKACMLTCIAAYYGGDIEGLNVIIMEYNRLKLLELKSKNQI